MFKVTLHAGEIKNATMFNMLGRLDFGYDKLAAVADYKAELFVAGFGAGRGAYLLKEYPRWTTSIWDLVARLIALGLYAREELPEMPTTGKGAYAKSMCAILEHWQDGEITKRSRIGTAQLTKRTFNCSYDCEVTDDLEALPVHPQAAFGHAPEVLQHWDLLARALNWSLHRDTALAPRPVLHRTEPFEFEGKPHVSLAKLPGPARLGFTRWLLQHKKQTRRDPEAPWVTLALEEDYERWLNKGL